MDSHIPFSDEIRAAFTDLREKGIAQHEAGDHRATEKKLAEAMRMLLSNSYKAMHHFWATSRHKEPGQVPGFLFVG